MYVLLYIITITFPSILLFFEIPKHTLLCPFFYTERGVFDIRVCQSQSTE